jgi:hypothetical protein
MEKSEVRGGAAEDGMRRASSTRDLNGRQV